MGKNDLILLDSVIKAASGDYDNRYEISEIFEILPNPVAISCVLVRAAFERAGQKRYSLREEKCKRENPYLLARFRVKNISKNISISVVLALRVYIQIKITNGC